MDRSSDLRNQFTNKVRPLTLFLEALKMTVEFSLPILVSGILITKEQIVVSFVIICVGMIFLNFNWSVAVDMTM